MTTKKKTKAKNPRAKTRGSKKRKLEDNYDPELSEAYSNDDLIETDNGGMSLGSMISFVDI